MLDMPLLFVGSRNLINKIVVGAKERRPFLRLWATGKRPRPAQGHMEPRNEPLLIVNVTFTQFVLTRHKDVIRN